jgi:hypothetical protein
MPHYANGKKAFVGDIVSGTSYNKNGVFIGVIKKITSENDTCNAVVERKIITVVGKNEEGEVVRTVLFDDGEDYTQVNMLTRISFINDDPESSLLAIKLGL